MLMQLPQHKLRCSQPGERRNHMRLARYCEDLEQIHLSEGRNAAAEKAEELKGRFPELAGDFDRFVAAMLPTPKDSPPRTEEEIRETVEKRLREILNGPIPEQQELIAG